MRSDFAHPAEQALADAFDELGIEWEYEPHTFLLEEEDGRVVEACTPDFYLPELDMYIECTSMRQDRTSRKNRKYRKLRERFGVTVEIMYRRDLVRLGLVYCSAPGSVSGGTSSGSGSSAGGAGSTGRSLSRSS